MSPEEIATVNSAMTRANGDRQIAADELKIEKRALTTLLHNNAPLKRLWCPARNSTVSAVELMKGVELQPIMTESPEIVEAKNDEAFERLLAKSLTPEEMEVGRSLSKMFGKHLIQCSNLIGGTLIERAMKLKAAIDKAQAEVDVGEFAQQYGEGAAAAMAATRKFITDGHNTLIGIMEIINRSAVARAKLKEMSQQSQGGMPHGRPGYGPKVHVVQNTLNIGK